MTNIEVKAIEEYAAQKGYTIRFIDIMENGSCHIKLCKHNAVPVGSWETEFNFFDFKSFKKEFYSKTKEIKKSGKLYSKNIKLKDNKYRREIKEYKRKNKHSKKMQGKYYYFFMETFELIKDGFLNHDERYYDILEYYSENYFAEYNRVLQNYSGVSRSVNLAELKDAYVYVAKNELFKYLLYCVKDYKQNPNNEYKSSIFMVNAPSDGLRILQKRYRINNARLKESFMYMVEKAADYVISFGASCKSVAEKTFFNNYISVAYPVYDEEMSYNRFKSVIVMCVNKNLKEEKKKKNNVFLLMPAIGIGYEGRKKKNAFSFTREIGGRAYGGVLTSVVIRVIIPPVIAAVVLTGSVLNTQNKSDKLNVNAGYEKSNEELGLGFLPFGIGRFLEDGIKMLAENNAAKKGTAADKTEVEAIGGANLTRNAVNPVGVKNPVSQVSFNVLGTAVNAAAGENAKSNAEKENSQNKSEPKVNMPSNNHPQENTPNESMPNESEPKVNTPNEGKPKENTPNENQPYENQPYESQPQENSPSESQPQENPANENAPQENMQNENEPLNNKPNSNEPNENTQNTNQAQNNMPQGLNPVKSILSTSSQTKNINEKNPQTQNNENKTNADLSESNAPKNAGNGANGTPYPSSPDDFNFYIFTPFPNPKGNPLILKPPPGSVDRNGNPKKNPKTGAN